MNPPGRQFSWYRDEIARQIGNSLRVREATAVSEPPVLQRTDERLAQCIWFDSLFLHDDLRTESGRPIEIIHPGRWNDEEGPDFRDARIRIDGAAQTLKLLLAR